MNTRYLKLLSLLAVLALAISACGMVPVIGSQELVRQERQVSDYQAISVSGGGELIIIQDGSESVSVETDSNLMQYVVAEVTGGTLHLYLDRQGLNNYLPSKLIFTVHVKELNAVETAGSWDVSAANLTAETLDITIGGSGEISLPALEADALAVTFSGSGEMDAAGEVGTQVITISGSGEYRGGDLHSEQATVEISGSGNLTLWVTESLNVDIGGSGEVQYYGNPQTEIETSGSGTIERLGDK